VCGVVGRLGLKLVADRSRVVGEGGLQPRTSVRGRSRASRLPRHDGCVGSRLARQHRHWPSRVSAPNEPRFAAFRGFRGATIRSTAAVVHLAPPAPGLRARYHPTRAVRGGHFRAGGNRDRKKEGEGEGEEGGEKEKRNDAPGSDRGNPRARTPHVFDRTGDGSSRDGCVEWRKGKKKKESATYFVVEPRLNRVAPWRRTLRGDGVLLVTILPRPAPAVVRGRGSNTGPRAATTASRLRRSPFSTAGLPRKGACSHFPTGPPPVGTPPKDRAIGLGYECIGRSGGVKAEWVIGATRYDRPSAGAGQPGVRFVGTSKLVALMTGGGGKLLRWAGSSPNGAVERPRRPRIAASRLGLLGPGLESTGSARPGREQERDAGNARAPSKSTRSVSEAARGRYENPGCWVGAAGRMVIPRFGWAGRLGETTAPGENSAVSRASARFLWV